MAPDAGLDSPIRTEPWQARAFGVRFELAFEAPGLRQAEVEREDAPDTLLELADLESDWPVDEARYLGGLADGDGSALIDIRLHPRRGILFTAPAHGRYAIEPGTRRVMCAPKAGPDWHWQRMLIGQVLPLVAAVRGFHVLHASAIVIDGRAVALSGAPGAGKSTLALELALQGHEILAEDVLSLRLDGAAVIAEPGVSLVNLRPTEDAERAVREGGFSVLGRSHKLHVDLPRASEPLPLSALLLLEDADDDAPLVEPVPAPSATEIISTSFVPYLTREQDLLLHLELGSAIATTVPTAKVRVDRRRPAAEIAAAVADYARSLPEPPR